MSYRRVIPRDLFNEANLLKCLGQLYLHFDKLAPHRVSMELDGATFDIEQDQADGSISVGNLIITIKGQYWRHSRPLNSRYPWPLYLLRGDEAIPAFHDSGDLSSELRDLLELP